MLAPMRPSPIIPICMGLLLTRSLRGDASTGRRLQELVLCSAFSRRAERRPSIGPVSPPTEPSAPPTPSARTSRASSARTRRPDGSRREELDERLDAAYAARTHGELTRLLEDLPPAPSAAGRGSRARRRAHEAGSPRRGGGDHLAAVRRRLGRRGRERLVLADLGHPPRRHRPGAGGLAHARPGRDADRRGARRASAAGAASLAPLRGALGSNSITEGEGRVWGFGGARRRPQACASWGCDRVCFATPLETAGVERRSYPL